MRRPRWQCPHPLRQSAHIRVRRMIESGKWLGGPKQSGKGMAASMGGGEMGQKGQFFHKIQNLGRGWPRPLVPTPMVTSWQQDGNMVLKYGSGGVATAVAVQYKSFIGSAGQAGRGGASRPSRSVPLANLLQGSRNTGF